MPQLRDLAFLLFLALAAPAAAQAPAPTAPLDWLVGSWSGQGSRFGRPTEATLEVRRALGGRFVELRYVSSGFEGRAFYRPTDAGRWVADWFDNRGLHLGIDAAVEDRVLTADWGGPGTERGRTIYRLRDDNRLEIIDTVVAGPDATHREFARHLLTRGVQAPTVN